MEKSNTLKKLISSTDLEDVKEALKLARAQNADLGLNDYDMLWKFVYQNHTS